LKRLIDFNPHLYGIIFTRTKIDAQDISDKLTREGYNVDSLHGDLNQQQRDRVMNGFRSKALQLVIATDVAARGIDVSGITHVINFELPDDVEVYTHRSGRTGRAGKTGICLSIVTPRDVRRINDIERIIKSKMNRLEIPTGKDVCRKQFFSFMDKLLDTDISHGDYETYLPMLSEKFAHISKEEVLQRVAALEFDRFLKYYENAEDLNIKKSIDRGLERRSPDRREREGDRRESFSSAGGSYQKLFVNLGTKDGFYKASLLQYILDLSDLPKSVLGRVDLKNMNSFIEVDKKVSDQMVKAIDGKTYKGRRIRMNEA
jgi:ATP-dependent RNA helicase DeaD